ncbi:class I adenylate-forming enzyme family protein [Streptomyces sp. NPDC059176]|uniref:class I adenylate-forming enzyme family protein n=1 Tax=Streptomyces sp. NPDC059176 TaxID=3346758 RepID=UPI003694FFB4
MTAKIFASDSVQTLEEFEDGALRVADALAERGVTPGQRVILKAGNSAAYVATLLGLMHAAASIILVDQQERPEETLRIARRTGAKLVLVDNDAPVADGLDPITLYELLVSAAGRTRLDSRLSFDTWCEMPDSLIMWTSGSTGSPKGIVKSGGKFLRNLRRNADQVGHVADDVLVPLLPFSHQYGLSMVLIAWLVRCSLVIAPYRRLDRSLVMAGQSGGTVFDATPASYRSMLNIVTRKPGLREHLDRVRMFCVGAAPLDQPLVDRYVEEFELPLLDSYGSTELGNVAFATLDNPVACGRAMEGIGLRVVDEEGLPVPAGRPGEIEVHTPDGLEGYLGEEGELVPVPGGWTRTGDLGHLDEQDNVFVLGRKYAVHRNGYTLHPELIERKAAAAGCSTRIVALDDGSRGSHLVFFVEDEEDRGVPHWREVLRGALPEFEHPNAVVAMDRFPLNRNGKPDKLLLQELAEKQRAGGLLPRQRDSAGQSRPTPA